MNRNTVLRALLGGGVFALLSEGQGYFDGEPFILGTFLFKALTFGGLMSLFHWFQHLYKTKKERKNQASE